MEIGLLLNEFERLHLLGIGSTSECFQDEGIEKEN